MADNPFARDPAVTVGVGADTSGFGSALDGAIGKLGNFRTAVGLTGLALGTLAAKGISESIGAFADFDEAMQESIAIMGDVDDAMREDLEETAREVARTTTASHEEAAESFYFLASAGLDAQESMEAMPQVAAFAEAGQLDMAQATDYATDIMSAFGEDAENLDEITDTLTATVTNHNQTMEGMGDAMSYAAPVAAGLGVDIEEASAAIGQMGDVGIKGQRAGTSLRRAMSELANPTGKAAELIEEMGVQTTDSEGNLLDMADIIGQFEDAGADASDMMQIFGQRAGPAMQALLDQGSDALEENTDEIREAEGVTEDVAETQRDTFNAQLEMMRSRLNDIGVTIGKQLMPHLLTLLDFVNDAVSRFAEFNERTDGMAGVVSLVAGVLGGFAAAAASAVSLLGGASAVVGALGAAFTVLTGPIGIAIAAIALLAGAWTSNVFGIRDKTRAAFEAVTSIVQERLELLREFVEPVVEGLRQVWADHGDEIQKEIDETMAHIQNVISDAIEFLRPYVEAALNALTTFLENHGDSIMTIVEGAWAMIRVTAMNALDVLLTLFSVGMNLIQGDWDEAWDDLAGLAERMLDRILDYAEEWGPKLKSAVVDILKGAGSAVGNAFTNAFNDAVPDEMSLPSTTIAGQTIGGGSLNLPQLDTGGFIEDGGLAMLHAGERVVPAAQVDRQQKVERVIEKKQSGASREMVSRLDALISEVRSGGGDVVLEVGERELARASTESQDRFTHSREINQ